jgi:hypothetical protein
MSTVIPDAASINKLEQTNQMVICKMRYLIFLVFVFISCNHCFSQKYTIPAPGAVWLDAEFDHLSVMGNSYTQQFEPTGDTTINSVKYTKIIRTGYANYYLTGPCSFDIGHKATNNYTGAIRTGENQCVFFIPDGDTTENLIYDFSVSTGDSVLLEGFHESYYAYIEDIDSIFIGTAY